MPEPIKPITPDPTPDPQTPPAAVTPPADPPAGDPPAGDGPPPVADPDKPEGAEALGDPGKRALDAMKAQRDAAKAEAKQVKQELAALKAPKPGDELTPEQLREQIRTEERAALRAPLLKAEIRGIAATIGANDPSDIHLFLKLDDFDPTPDGGFDADEITEKVTDLKAKKPWLFQTPAGQPGTGPAPKVPAPPAHGSPPAPLNLEQQIAKATADGDFSLALRLQNQKLANVEPK